MDQQVIEKLDNPAKLLISWLISEIWEAQVSASIGDLFDSEEKLTNVLGVLQRAGLTEEHMSCLEEIPDFNYQQLLSEVRKWEEHADSIGQTNISP